MASSTNKPPPPLPHSHFLDASAEQQRQPRLNNPPMTPPELDIDLHLDLDLDLDLQHDKRFLNGIEEVARDIDRLVYRLNRRPILQDSIRWHLLDAQGRNGAAKETQNETRSPPKDANINCTQPSMQLDDSDSTPALNPIPELSMPYDPCSFVMPPLCDALPPPDPVPFDEYVPDAPPHEKPLPRPNDLRRPRRSTDVRLHKSASNLRMLGLVTGMIENGVQCNVQNSTPPSPAATSTTSSAIAPSMRYIEPSDAIEPHCVPPEVDMGFSELDEETMLHDSLALRHASTPAGIRKFGFLRYRSSTEAAQGCKNMKKSVPRMRRRHKTTTTSTSASITSRPPSSVS